MYGKFGLFMSHPFLSAVSNYTGGKKSENRSPIDIQR